MKSRITVIASSQYHYICMSLRWVPIAKHSGSEKSRMCMC